MTSNKDSKETQGKMENVDQMKKERLFVSFSSEEGGDNSVRKKARGGGSPNNAGSPDPREDKTGALGIPDSDEG
ncbi:hypothetical protein [Sulfidibacter corallicola]|uniref:Uncharacterized protein n=1 Tax=Sulfidibacter corallicola TaxID=2818388 RepID=A0A8A4TNT5_SULCO|nr:hypothetical protein [Sulfidibacter corallicola]QTD51636.1 hypothetical protein J3U87_04130 [Sulfidibacter corallicola]